MVVVVTDYLTMATQKVLLLSVIEKRGEFNTEKCTPQKLLLLLNRWQLSSEFWFIKKLTAPNYKIELKSSKFVISKAETSTLRCEPQAPWLKNHLCHNSKILIYFIAYPFSKMLARPNVRVMHCTRTTTTVIKLVAGSRCQIRERGWRPRRSVSWQAGCWIHGEPRLELHPPQMTAGIPPTVPSASLCLRSPR